jgi:rRNA small subunit pseudouridine methyltransferase Nep1
MQNPFTKGLIVVLENASLQTAKIGDEYQLLNCDDHINFMKKRKRDPSEMRPDITHQCMLTLLDSPLNKAGHLKLYIHTKDNVLIDVNSQIRIPRTFKRFSGLMVQLLQKMSIKASDGPGTLLKVVKNPVEAHLPTGCTIIGTSHSAPEVVDIFDFVPALFKKNDSTKVADVNVKSEVDTNKSDASSSSNDGVVVFVIGAMSHGRVEVGYVQQQISFSHYPLSASVACGRLCNAFEKMWGII